MIDVIALAVKAGVIDSADINSVHIPEGYVADLTKFARMAAAAERAETLKWLHLFHDNLIEAGNQHGPRIVQLVIKMLEELQ